MNPNPLRERVHALYNIINDRGLYVNTNHDVFMGKNDEIAVGVKHHVRLLKDDAQAYASPLLFPTLTSLLKHGTMLLTGAPGIGKTTSAEYAGHFFTGESIEDILQATIQGHPQQTEEKMVARYDTGKLVKDGIEVILPRKFLTSPVKIIDEINRLDPDKISIILRLIDTGIAVYGDQVLRATQGPLFATANYTDAGTFDIPQPAKDRFDVAVVVTSPQPWDLERIFARGDEKLNGGLMKLLEIPDEIKMSPADYETVRHEINALPIDPKVQMYLPFAIASLRFSEASSDEIARMTKGNAWADSDCIDPHFIKDAPHLLTKNELSVRTARAIMRYASALAWFTGKTEVDKESVDTVWPYCTWHKLEPSEKMLTEKKIYNNDRIGFAQHVIESISSDWTKMEGAPALKDYAVAIDTIYDPKVAAKERRSIVTNAIGKLGGWDQPYAICLAKHLESAYNETVMKR